MTGTDNNHIINLRVNKHRLFHVERSGAQDAFPWTGEQFRNRRFKTLTFEVRAAHRKVRSELCQHLPTSTAGRHRVHRIGDNRQRFKLPLPSRHGRKDGIPLGADGQTEGKILDITPGENPSTFRPQRRTHREMGIGRIGAPPDMSGCWDQVIEIHNLFLVNTLLTCLQIFMAFSSCKVRRVPGYRVSGFS
jgi:hypothetical protein